MRGRSANEDLERAARRRRGRLSVKLQRQARLDAEAYNDRVGAAIVKTLSTVKIDSRVIEVLTAVDLNGELDGIAMRGARYGFPGWVAQETTKGGKVKRVYLERPQALAKAHEYLAGAQRPGRFSGGLRSAPVCLLSLLEGAVGACFVGGGSVRTGWDSRGRAGAGTSAGFGLRGDPGSPARRSWVLERSRRGIRAGARGGRVPAVPALQRRLRALDLRRQPGRPYRRRHLGGRQRTAPPGSRAPRSPPWSAATRNAAKSTAHSACSKTPDASDARPTSPNAAVTPRSGSQSRPNAA